MFPGLLGCGVLPPPPGVVVVVGGGVVVVVGGVVAVVGGGPACVGSSSRGVVPRRSSVEKSSYIHSPVSGSTHCLLSRAIVVSFTRADAPSVATGRPRHPCTAASASGWVPPAAPVASSSEVTGPDQMGSASSGRCGPASSGD